MFTQKMLTHIGPGHTENKAFRQAKKSAQERTSKKSHLTMRATAIICVSLMQPRFKIAKHSPAGWEVAPEAGCQVVPTK